LVESITMLLISHTHSCCLSCYLLSQFSGLLRSILGNLGASRHVRLLAYAKCAVYGLEEQTRLESSMSRSILYSFQK
jgi:hypothetical protein